MQNTRLSTLIDQSLTRLVIFLRNPWRRLSVLIISILSGNFLATVISTISGQKADLDVVVAIFLLLLNEIVSWLVYRGDPRPPDSQRTLIIESLNGIKLGMTYGLFVEAFKLGS
jgi:Protein of unknown function (DUF565)